MPPPSTKSRRFLLPPHPTPRDCAPAWLPPGPTTPANRRARPSPILPPVAFRTTPSPPAPPTCYLAVLWTRNCWASDVSGCGATTERVAGGRASTLPTHPKPSRTAVVLSGLYTCTGVTGPTAGEGRVCGPGSDSSSIGRMGRGSGTHTPCRFRCGLLCIAIAS
jgi:hypothetical protein